MEFRNKMSTFVHSYAVNQFTKGFKYNGQLMVQKLILRNIKDVNEIYRPHRLYKKKNISPVEKLESNVNITLLEYGLDGEFHKQCSSNIINFIEEDDAGEASGINRHY